MNAKILIVDDEPAMREVIGILLKDFTIMEAKDGFEAVNICETMTPDLILMDIQMPRMNGVIATKHIMKKRPDTKIVAVTAHQSTKGDEILEAGAIEILEKPFKRNELIEMVHRITNTPKKVKN